MRNYLFKRKGNKKKKEMGKRFQYLTTNKHMKIHVSSFSIRGIKVKTTFWKREKLYRE
jgi:hypothetical protein